MKFDSVSFLKKLVSFKSVSANPELAGSVRECGAFLRDFMRQHGFESELVETPLHPIVWAKRNCKTTPKARILCYGHYDVQPVEPLCKWNSDPFVAVEKNGKLCGRGTADNKGPFTALLSGYLNFLDKNPDNALDIAFIFDGEEEVSSPSMAKFIDSHKDELAKYDIVLLSDTMSPDKSQILVTTGIRGMVSFDAVFKGANSDLHSGMYGGMVYNPLQAMCEVLASLHGADGLVAIDGFYEAVKPVCDWEVAETKKLPITPESIKKELNVEALYSQKGVDVMASTRAMPTLEINGIGGGWQGNDLKTIIPAECFCKISCRLVPDQEPSKILKLVQSAILQRCPKGVKVSFKAHNGGGAKAYYIDAKTESEKDTVKGAVLRSLKDAVCEVFGKPPLFVRDGGSISLVAYMHDVAKLDFVMTGLFTPQDNLHAPNESFYLEMLEKGAKLYELLFEKLSK